MVTLHAERLMIVSRALVRSRRQKTSPFTYLYTWLIFYNLLMVEGDIHAASETSCNKKEEEEEG